MNSSKDVADYLRHLYDEDSLEIRESAYALFLNKSLNTIGWFKISEGSIDGTVMDIRLVIRQALICCATNVIISHNHPSGNLYPSSADIELTNKFKRAFDTMDITLLDHVILTKDSYYSFIDEGKL